MSEVFVIVDGKLLKMVDEDHPNRVKATTETLNAIVEQLEKIEQRLHALEKNKEEEE